MVGKYTLEMQLQQSQQCSFVDIPADAHEILPLSALFVSTCAVAKHPTELNLCALTTKHEKLAITKENFMHTHTKFINIIICA